MTILAHVSDLHLIEDDYRSRDDASRRRLEFLTLARKKDPKARRLRAVAALRSAWETGADHLVITGDLTEDGVDAQFDVLAEVLDASPWPAGRVTLVAGNHDAYTTANAFDRALDRPLARFAATSRPGSITVLPGVLVVAVSTAIKQSYGRAMGGMEERAFEGLARAAKLAASTGRVAVAAMHHGPFARGFAPLQWIDGLREHARMTDLLRAHDGLFVLHGHTHEPSDSPVRRGGALRVFSARAAVDGVASARVYQARFGQLCPVREFVCSSHPPGGRVNRASALLVLLSSVFHAAVIGTLLLRLAFRRRAARRSSVPVSILKPIAGDDPELADNLASFARLEGEFELLLGFASADEPSLPVARAFLRDHPDLDAKIVWTRGPRPLENPKVAQLALLERAAKCEVLVISDANVRVRRDYLDELVSTLDRPGVGLATSLVVGRGGQSFGADLDAAELLGCVAPVAATADALSIRAVAIGKSMAMRRSALAATGGFAAVAGVLAEDDTLARLFEAAGFGVALSLSSVESRAGKATVQSTFDRHARWAKMRRAVSPSCLALELFGLPSIVAAAAFVAAPSSTSAVVVALSLGLQMTGAGAAAWGLLGTPKAALRFALLEPLRTIFHAACVVRAWSSRRVQWKGHTFRLGPGTTLLPIESSSVLERARALVSSK